VITFREAEVAAGSALEGSVAPAGDMNVAWLVWRLVPADWRAFAGRTAIEDYTVVDKRRLQRGPSGAAFEFHIPDAGPFSHEGKLIRVVWQIVAGTESASSPAHVAEFASFKVVPAAFAAA
jgi:hypothetical protein